MQALRLDGLFGTAVAARFDAAWSMLVIRLLDFAPCLWTAGRGRRFAAACARFCQRVRQVLIASPSWPATAAAATPRDLFRGQHRRVRRRLPQDMPHLPSPALLRLIRQRPSIKPLQIRAVL